MKTGISESAPGLGFNIKETVKISVKFLGIVAWMIVLGMTLLEVKQYYNIDLIPGVNTSVEDLHSVVFSGITKYF